MLSSSCDIRVNKDIGRRKLVLNTFKQNNYTKLFWQGSDILGNKTDIVRLFIQPCYGAFYHPCIKSVCPLSYGLFGKQLTEQHMRQTTVS